MDSGKGGSATIGRVVRAFNRIPFPSHLPHLCLATLAISSVVQSGC